MATSGEATQRILRISDIDKELQQMLMPIGGYEDLPIVPLEEAVKPLVFLLPAVHSHAYVAKQRCEKPPADGLTEDESAAIMLYSMGWQPLEKCLYFALNAILRSEDRRELKPWFLYLKLFLTALARLPSKQETVYRGVKMNLSDRYAKGKTVVWWGFSSCTASIDVLQSELFYGTTGERTMFAIKCRSGKDICKHSYYTTEDEILLLAATQFKVVGSLNQGGGLHMIQLEETTPPYPLLQPVRPVSNSNKQSSDYQTKETTKPTDKKTATIVDKIKSILVNNKASSNQWSQQQTEPNQHRNSQLEKKIKQSKPRSEVELTDMKLNDRDIDIVSQLAIHNKQCTTLCLTDNEITSVGASILAEALNNNNTLERLYLRGNRVSDSGVESLAKTLTNDNHTLEELVLDSNGITDSGCEHLAQMLKTNQTLTDLSLSSNEISDRGVRVLCQAIKHNHTLRDLTLSDNKLLTDASVDSLEDIIRHHRSLKVFASSCNLSPTGKERLREAAAEFVRDPELRWLVRYQFE